MQIRNKILRGVLPCAISTFFCLIVMCQSIHGQIASTATLNGTVVDPTHAVVPNAQVKLTNDATGVSQSVKTNGSGDFVFPDEPSGTFTLNVETTGFKALNEGGIHLAPGDQRSLHEVVLQPGAASETVRVAAATQSITLDSGTSSTLISTEDIQHLSIEGRDVTELLKVLPGFAISGGNNNVSNTTYDPSQVTVTGAYGSYSGEGTISNSVALLYDGIDYTDPGAFASVLQNINYDQVSEVNVETSSLTADQAYGPIIINAVGKSGGDKYHGSLYTYGRTYQLDSADWLANYDNQAKPTDFEVYPGFTLGGPILIPHAGFNRDRHLTFFAGAEDYAQRDVYAYGNASSAILTALVPTAAMRTGDFSQQQINQYLGPLVNSSTYANISRIPATGLNGAPLTNGQMGTNVNPTMQALLNTLPLPNQATNAQGFNYAVTNLIDNDEWQAQGRIDDAIGSRNKLFVMYSTERGKEGVPQVEYYSPRGPLGGTNTPGGGMLADLNAESGTLDWTFIVSPTLTNELSVSGVYFDQDYVAKDNAALTLNGSWNFPGIFNNGSHVIPQFADYGDDGLPVNLYPDTSFGGIYAKKWIRTGEDNLTKVLGRHTLRVGVYAQLDSNHQITPFVATNGNIAMYYIGSTYNDTPAGTTAYSTGAIGSGNGGNYLADFLEGGVFTYGQTNISPAPDLYFWTLDGYAQDHYHVTPYLSVDYGVRFSHLTPWTDSHNIGIPVWDPPTYATGQNPSLPGFLWHALDPAIPASGLATRWAFVQPRVGFAWDLHHNGQTVLRGGAGIYTAHDSSNDVETPASSAVGERSVTVTGPLLLQDVPSQAPTALAGGSFVPTQNGYGFMANDDHQPQVYTYNLAIDQRMPFNSLAEIGYIGNLSRHLLNNGSTQPVTLDNINAIPIGGLYKPDPVTGQTYALACPPTAPTGSCTAVSGLSQQQVDDYRPYPLYDELEVGQHNVNANYNSLQLIWNKQSGALFYGVNYTWSKALGVRGADGNGTPATPFNYRDDYGPEAFDRSQAFNATYSYTTGTIVHQRLLGGLTNGWMISGITTIQSGPDLLATNNPDFSLTGQLNVDYNGQNVNIPVSSQELLGTPDVYLMPQLTCNPGVRTGGDHYVNGNCFSLEPSLGVNGPFREPYIHGPAFTDSDLAVQKSFGLGESRHILVRYSAFNFLNHANTTFNSSVEPNNIDLSFNNLAQNTYQSINSALTSATNANASGFGYAPIRTGRRVSEIELNFSF